MPQCFVVEWISEWATWPPAGITIVGNWRSPIFNCTRCTRGVKETMGPPMKWWACMVTGAVPQAYGQAAGVSSFLPLQVQASLQQSFLQGESSGQSQATGVAQG